MKSVVFYFTPTRAFFNQIYSFVEAIYLNIKSPISPISLIRRTPTRMNSVLDVKISCFKNYRASDNPQPVHLITWLKSKKYAEQVKRIRKVTDKKERDRLKATLPAITPSGIFTYRSNSNLTQHSGLIQFDIDGKDHTDIANFASLKEQLTKIKEVAYAGLSVSGRGYWGLIPIKYPDKHKSHFRALKKAFANLGLTLDDKPSNVASLRGYSFDPNGFFNHNAKVFNSLDQGTTHSATSHHFTPNRRSEVETLIASIQSNHTDITDGYENWLNIGFAFADEFGEHGRTYFHAVSQYHPNYTPRKTDQQFTHCLRSGGKGVTIATFFHLCKEHGITLKREKSTTTLKQDGFSNKELSSSQKKLHQIRKKEKKAQANYSRALKEDPILREIDSTFEPEIIF